MAKNRKLITTLIVAAVLTIPRFTLVGIRTVPEIYFDKPFPEKAGAFTMLDVYVCDRCTELIDKFLFEGDRAILKEKMSFYFFEKALKDGLCPYHDRPVKRTSTVPTHPQTIRGLPEDTEFINHIYSDSEDLSSPATHKMELHVIISGADKRSIHRPERCLPGQGHRIVRRYRKTIRLSRGNLSKLDVMVLVLKAPVRDSRSRVSTQIIYYWFAGNRRVTASNYERLALTAWDRMVLGDSYRWSYILVISSVRTTVRDTMGAMDEFLADFFPQVEK